MKTRLLFVVLAAVAASAVLVAVTSADSLQTLSAAQIAQFSAQLPDQMTVMDAPDPLMDPPPFKQVKPHEYDPAHTILVQAQWSGATGCPTSSDVATYPATSPTGTYTDPACATGDSKDNENDGLVLVKTGPTSNNAAAIAELKGVKGITLTELGYDIRKNGPGTHLGPQGSHCGAGAPRFNITTTVDSYFIGCSSPPPDSETPGQAWIRLRWGGSVPLMGYNSSFVLGPVMGTVKSIYIVFDEGTDTGPDFFGEAILDNVDVNGTLVGHGPDESEP
jgi:hypothetical protein